ncbi:MAG: hypothetical protein II842_18000 [Butyrivibrio sp.]|nr:hypothetical protein [Butyrivibrio sp.]
MAGYSDIGTAAAGMFGGSIEKATLYVLNPSYDSIKDDEIGTAANELIAAIRDGTKEASIMEKAQNIIDDVGKNEALVPQKFDGFGNDSGKAIGVASKIKSQFIKFEVQYNPESIRLYSAIGKQQEVNKQDSGMNKMNIYNLTGGKTRMSFDLIFDDVDVPDSFMLDGVNLNASAAVSKVKDMATHDGGFHSVRKVMDAFLALLSSIRTQQVVFAWSKMTFRGMLTNVSNRYTMFNTSGNPVRGIMHLEITQETKEDNVFNYDEKEWQKAFETRFSESSDVGIASKASKAMNNGVMNIDI